MDEIESILRILYRAHQNRNSRAEAIREGYIPFDAALGAARARRTDSSPPYVPKEYTPQDISTAGDLIKSLPMGDGMRVMQYADKERKLLSDFFKASTPRAGIVPPDIRGALNGKSIRQIWRQPFEHWGSILMGLLLGAKHRG